MKWLIGCLLLMLSGFAFVKNNSLDDFFLLAVIPAVVFVGITDRTVIKALCLVLLFLSLHFALILRDFGTNSLLTYIGFFLVLALSIVLAFTKDREIYFEYVLRLTVLLSLVSIVYSALVFVFGEEVFLALGNGVASFDSRGSPCFGIVNHRLHPGTSYFRNSGPFWEPGAFAVFLVLVLFHGFRLGTLTIWRALVISLAVLSTFSTSGLVMLMIFILYSVMKIEVLSKPLVLLILVVTGLAVFGVSKLDLIAGKIGNQSRSVEQDVGLRNTRFAIGLYDVQDYLDHNVFYGKGPSSDTRYRGVDDSMARANGLSNFLVKWGGVGFVILSVIVVRGGLIWMALIVVAGMSQDIFVYPLTWFLIFLGNQSID